MAADPDLTPANEKGVATSPATAVRTFYVSASGKDGSDGLTPRTAWKTIAGVNDAALTAGDVVLFRGGDTFAGSLTIAPAAQPSEATRIKVSSFGNGRATIAPKSGYGIKLLDCGFVTISGLNVVGRRIGVSSTLPNKSVSATAVAFGIVLENTSVDTYRSGIVIEDVEVSGAENGIEAHNTHVSPAAGFDALRISRAKVHHTRFGGIVIWGKTAGDGTFFTRLNRNIRISDCEVSDTYGTGIGYASGFGVVVFNAVDSFVERCVAHNCGEASSNSAPNGVCAFIFAFCTRCRFSRCEGYDVWAPNNVDGNAFDFDADCDDCVCEYCYGHDTDGAAFLHWNKDNGVTASGGCVVRFCIFVNGGRRNSSNGGACFATDGAVGSPLVHNCVFWRTHNGAGLAELVKAAEGTTRFYNNIFAVARGAVFGNFGAQAPFGNTYYVGPGSSFAITLNGVSYGSLAAMRAVDYEKVNGVNVGAEGDPVFNAGGATPVMLPQQEVARLTAYDLGEGSMARGAGADLRIVAPGIEFAALTDWHGRAFVDAGAGDSPRFDSGAVRTMSGR